MTWVLHASRLMLLTDAILVHHPKIVHTALLKKRRIAAAAEAHHTAGVLPDIVHRL